ncbi:MAG: Na(+)-translocating NADH-quinone reductase subunit C [Bacteriovoracaceae bacterium]|nr:Na(+)-translocating NADH-quinone reductase subunit C [Bacteriovoracaceae bacterium]
MSNDTVGKTLGVAAALCIVCSILVSTSAVQLKPRQVENKKLDIKKNLLLASKLIDNPKASKDEILKAFEKVEARIVNLETGEEVSELDPDKFDAKKASKDPGMSIRIDKDKDSAGIKRRSKYAKVYYVKNDETGSVEMIVLPVYGKGLWSTLYGFLALAPDTRTVKGLGFYQHGETPGLGGEVDNPSWKAKWVDKIATDENYKPIIKVLKGPAPVGSKTEIDGLSGATLTSNGVTGLVQYWLGENGFGPFLSKIRSAGGVSL